MTYLLILPFLLLAVGILALLRWIFEILLSLCEWEPYVGSPQFHRDLRKEMGDEAYADMLRYNKHAYDSQSADLWAENEPHRKGNQ